MARTFTNYDENGNLPATIPFMDRLSHDVIKETSKHLKHYIDVKRREEGFVLNPNSSLVDSPPLKARYLYGTTKEYPSNCKSCYTDYDIKNYLCCFRQQEKQLDLTQNTCEQRMCRQELKYHMGSTKYLPRECRLFSELSLRKTTRSSSSCSCIRDYKKPTLTSSTNFPINKNQQLVNHTANMLATMIKKRQEMCETNFPLQQTIPEQIIRQPHTSPRQLDDQSHTHSIPTGLTSLETGSKLPTVVQKPKKRTADDELAKSISIMQNAKPITNGILCDYIVSVTTGNCNGASTDASIQIKFFGINGCTDFKELLDSKTHRVPFAKNHTDVFTVRTEHVGTLVGITIGHDRKDIRSSWFLSKVSIEDPIRKITYDISCNAWLSISSNDQKTKLDFPVTSKTSKQKLIDSDDEQEETESKQNSSPRLLASPATSNNSNSVRANHSTTFKQRDTLIRPKTAPKKKTSLDETSKHLSQPSLSSSTTTIESHLKQNQTSKSPLQATGRSHSPNISDSSADEDFDNNKTNDSRPRSPIPEPTTLFNHSNGYSNSPRIKSSKITNGIFKQYSRDDDQETPRSKDENSLISKSTERPITNKEKANDDETDFQFFD